MITKSRARAWIRLYTREILKSKGTPYSIALGVGFGSFIAILPTPFLNVGIGVVVVVLFKQVNKIALFSSIAFWNPLTLTPIYVTSYRIGEWLMRNEPKVEYEITLLDQAFRYSKRFLVGNAMLAASISLVASIAAYYIAWAVIARRDANRTASRKEE